MLQQCNGIQLRGIAVSTLSLLAHKYIIYIYIHNTIYYYSTHYVRDKSQYNIILLCCFRLQKRFRRSSGLCLALASIFAYMMNKKYIYHNNVIMTRFNNIGRKSSRGALRIYGDARSYNNNNNIIL